MSGRAAITGPARCVRLWPWVAPDSLTGGLPAGRGAGSEILKDGAELTAGTVKPRHHGPDRCAHDGRDLPAGVALDVGQVHRGAKVFGERLKRASDTGIRQVPEGFGLGRPQPGRGSRPGTCQLLVPDLAGARWLRLAPPLPVIAAEGVRQDRV